jgi:SAM-dependent methyltransferase
MTELDNKQPSKATDPKQYDRPETNWLVRGAENSPSRRYLRESLEQFVPEDAVQGQRVVDIGSGTGYLFKWLKQKGAVEIHGFDPSLRNVEKSKQDYPFAESYLSTLESFAEAVDQKYNTAFAVMVIEHIENLHDAFHNIHTLLVTGGTLVLVVGDKDDELSSEVGSGKHIVSAETVRQLPNEVVEVRVERRLGSGVTSVVYDILRPLTLVRETAKEAGFKLVAEKPIMSRLPSKMDKPIFHMMRFVHS